MSQYKNVASKKIVIANANGALVEIAPGQSVDLPDHIARKGFPYLQMLNESASSAQLLTEAPAPLEVVQDGEKPKVKSKSKKK